MTAAAAPATGARLRTLSWAQRVGGVAALVVAASCVPGDALALATAALTVLAVVVAAGCGLARSWADVASGLLPVPERAHWRAEVRAVLDAAQDGPERRRQLWGFVLGLPSCAVTSWCLALRRN